MGTAQLGISQQSLCRPQIAFYEAVAAAVEAVENSRNSGLNAPDKHACGEPLDFAKAVAGLQHPKLKSGREQHGWKARRPHNR